MMNVSCKQIINQQNASDVSSCAITYIIKTSVLKVHSSSILISELVHVMMHDIHDIDTGSIASPLILLSTKRVDDDEEKNDTRNGVCVCVPRMSMTCSRQKCRCSTVKAWETPHHESFVASNHSWRSHAHASRARDPSRIPQPSPPIHKYRTLSAVR